MLDFPGKRNYGYADRREHCLHPANCDNNNGIDAPVVVTPTPPATIRHEFNRFDYLLYGGVVAYRIGDYVTTEHSLSRGGVEAELPTVLVMSKPAFLSYSLGMAAGEIAASYWLHKHGHAKLARFADTLSVAAGAAVDVHNTLVSANKAP